MSNGGAAPDEYIRENRETLVEIIKHSDDDFTRALAIIVLKRYGDEPDLDQVKKEIDVAREVDK